jgi:hypothetical protein
MILKMILKIIPKKSVSYFNCELVTNQDISIVEVPQIVKSTNEVRETLKLSGT